MNVKDLVVTNSTGVPSSSPSAFRTCLVWVMGLFAAIYAIGLALSSLGLIPMVNWLTLAANQWLGLLTVLLTVWAPAAVCWLAVVRVGLRRQDVLLAAAAITSFAAGNTYYVLETSTTGSNPFPSPGDVGLLLFYPLMVAALTVAVRQHVRGLVSSVWLDCAVGSLGAAAVLAVLLSPVLNSALTGSRSLATIVSIAYPMFDLLLVAAVAGIATLGGRCLGSRWGLLMLGLVVFAATDVVYALQVNADVYQIGTPLDAGWAIGLALVALWVDGASRQDRATTQEACPTTRAAALVVSWVATTAGLGVLVLGTRTPLSTLAVVLASVTLLAAAARTQLAFRQLEWMADLRRKASTTDDLTGLANRRALYAEGRARLEDRRQVRRALLMLDLDKFKEVNDSLGHQVGDLLLVEVGTRLRENLRPDDLLVRLGGDEFAVLLNDAGHDEASEVAAKLREALAEPLALEDITLHTSASIGIALFPEHGPDLSALLRRADIAMYKAKTSGHGQHVYSGVDDADDTTRLQTVEELRTALATDQLVLHYQPIVDLDTGEVQAVEALVRWEHPTRGLLYPDAFLNMVEESGLMPSMTRVVLARALNQVADWRAQGQQLTVSVNLSASSLVDSDLPKQVASMLAGRGVPTDALRLEITEEFLMADRDRARTILSRLRQSGVEISVDDFGTGYSSLSYLRDLPIDELKLDRSFITPMTEDDHAAALVASTIDLAHSLGLRMVAEGVETDLAYAELARRGCDHAQGYYLSRPIPAAELSHWLSDRLALALAADFGKPSSSVPLDQATGRRRQCDV